MIHQCACRNPVTHFVSFGPRAVYCCVVCGVKVIVCTMNDGADEGKLPIIRRIGA
jgi:hypothetical protein